MYTKNLGQIEYRYYKSHLMTRIMYNSLTQYISSGTKCLMKEKKNSSTKLGLRLRWNIFVKL